MGKRKLAEERLSVIGMFRFPKDFYAKEEVDL